MQRPWDAHLAPATSRRSKGQSVVVERGFIARSTTINVFFHAATSRAAIDGLRRTQAHHSNTAADLAAKSQQCVAAFCKRWFSPDLIVTLDANAHAIGACNSGIKSWCYATGLQNCRSQWVTLQPKARNSPCTLSRHCQKGSAKPSFMQ